MDEKLSWVYMTCGSLDEAREIGQLLLEKNLAACVNILDGMRSLFRWEGAVQEDQSSRCKKRCCPERLCRWCT